MVPPRAAFVATPRCLPGDGFSLTGQRPRAKRRRATKTTTRAPKARVSFSMNTSNRPLLLGAIDARHQHGRRFGIRPADLMRHVHVLGRSGSGKSVLLERLALGVVREGMGLALLDPHGDLAARVLDRLPRERTNDVVVLDAWETIRPVGWNPLDRVNAHDRALVASGVLATFRKVFFESWGPRLEHILRNTLLALLDVEGTTLLSAMRMLVDVAFRERVAARVKDPLVKFFWTKEFAKYPPTFLQDAIAPVQNKLAAAMTSPYLRAILGQRRSTVTARDLLAERRILVADLGRGRVGDDASTMLGATLVSSIQLAAYGRAAVSPGARPPFVLVVDEFHAFATESFGELLAEARKYGLGLVLAHQHLGQLSGALVGSLLGNCGTLIAFRTGAEDAEVLAREFAPELDARDLVRLARHQVAMRLAVDGMTTRPFTATTLPPEEEGTGRAMLLRRLSSERYGRDANLVARENAEDLGMNGPPAVTPARGTNLPLGFA